MNAIPISWFRRRGLCGLWVFGATLLVCGCTDPLWGPETSITGEPIGEKWTIRCMEFRGPQATTYAAQVVEVLKRTPGIRPNDVFVDQTDSASTLYYGTYYWRRAKGKTPDREKKWRGDLDLIRELVDERGTHFFADAQLVNYPEPDAGRPEWHIRNIAGRNTLRIATFYNTDTFHERKKTAAELCEELRNSGYEAYYWHLQSKSIVTVGAFGPEAASIQNGVILYSPEVQALRGKEHFIYELENGHIVKRIRDGKKLTKVSEIMLVNIDDETAY